MMAGMIILRGLLRVLRTRRAPVLENLALRHQLAVLQRAAPRPRLHHRDRLFWVFLCRLWSGWADALSIVPHPGHRLQILEEPDPPGASALLTDFQNRNHIRPRDENFKPLVLSALAVPATMGFHHNARLMAQVHHGACDGESGRSTFLWQSRIQELSAP